jgi:hypothetical protein
MRKLTIWDILFWFAMAVLILFILGKLTGIINTPDWVNLIPLISLVFLIGAFYQKVTSFIETMYRRTDYLKSNLDKISNKINEQDKSILLLQKSRSSRKP